jgi:pSer/pThr/pTyr-binding forkhead associated (FHA) protein
MHVKLRVTSGSHAGKEISITKNRFLIGRGQDCQLRPQTDMVSRRHCEIVIEGGKVQVKDLGSRNGTHVNDEMIEGPRELKMGDRLRIGPLEFQIFIDHSPGGAKRAQVKSVQQAAARTVEAGAKASDDIDDSDVTGWLTEEDEADRARRLADPETRQYRLNEEGQVESDEAAGEAGTKDGKKEKKKKKEYGKLPERPEDKPKDTRDAAERMLRKFFDQGPT